MKKMFLIILIVLSFFISISITVCAADGYLVQLKSGYIPSASLDIELINEGCRLYFTHDKDIESKIGEHIETISENYDVEMPQMEVFPSLSSNDYYYSRQWALGALNVQAAWDMETYGNDIRVAVIDSGYSYHPDLDANVLPGENFYVTVENDFGDFSSVSADDVTDNNGHGTHVSGIIAAVANNGIGVAGVAPKAKIVPLKCFEPGCGTSVLMLANAICDAVDEYGCQIINMSWTTETSGALLKSVIDYAYSKGAILVAAVGNDGKSTTYYPANYSNVIGVGSIDSNKTKSYFSNFNDSVTVVAPGSSIMSTYKASYGNGSGTSQATPMVSALAAIALSAKPDLTNSEFMEILTETATDLGDEGYDTSYGYGLANADAMMNKITENSYGYISPVNYEGGKPYVFIKNTSATDGESYITAIADFAETGGIMNSCEVQINILNSGEGKKITFSGYENPSIFFWQLPYLRPLWYRRY